MDINELVAKIGECKYQLAFAEKNGSIKRITSCYVSGKRKLVILGSPYSLIEED